MWIRVSTDVLIDVLLHDHTVIRRGTGSHAKRAIDMSCRMGTAKLEPGVMDAPIRHSVPHRAPRLSNIHVGLRPLESGLLDTIFFLSTKGSNMR